MNSILSRIEAQITLHTFFSTAYFTSIYEEVCMKRIGALFHQFLIHNNRCGRLRDITFDAG